MGIEVLQSQVEEGITGITILSKQYNVICKKDDRNTEPIMKGKSMGRLKQLGAKVLQEQGKE